jgi:hypothetical protein
MISFLVKAEMLKEIQKHMNVYCLRKLPRCWFGLHFVTYIYKADFFFN